MPINSNEHGGVYKVEIFLEDGTSVRFRTDEWNEDIILERLGATGKQVVKVERENCSGSDHAPSN